MKKTGIVFVLLCLCFMTCNSTDDSISMVDVNFAFLHTWDDTVINNTNLTTVNVTNANGEIMDMTRLRYLTSRFELVNSNGTTYTFDGYKFTDLSNPASYNFTPTNNSIPPGDYTLKFIWGFNEADNIDGAYPDLNSASWNWPAQLGGGYHFLQLDGKYNITTTAANYNFHNGTARVSATPPVFEQNFVEISFPTTIVIQNNSEIEVVMNIAEFFKNPHVWDLNVLDTPLMPNYTAQKRMQDNVGSVFSLGAVTN